MTKRRAIGITRVSQEGSRAEERLYSYAEQAEAIQADCRERGVHLLYVGQERTVSGGAQLTNRPELSRAVEAIERGEADVIVAAYFDRFFRNVGVQAEVIERVERAGGELLTLDHGQLTNGTAAQRLQANVVGAMSQYFREQGREKSRIGQGRAVARGATPWARIPLGYTRREDGTLTPDPKTVPIAQEAFRMRAAGLPLSQVRAMLRERGVERSPRGVQVMLASRVYLGEVRFGEFVNHEAHEPIVAREVWDRVQLTVTPRGRQPSSTRLLARLRVLRCGSCGTPLMPMKLPKQGDYPIYRCPSTSDCSRHMTVSAVIAETVVWDAVVAKLDDAQGHASLDSEARTAAIEAERAEATLQSAMRLFAGFDEPGAQDRLEELRADRDEKRERAALLNDSGGARTVDVRDPHLSWDARRALIRATVRRAMVNAGRGADRIAVEFFGQ